MDVRDLTVPARAAELAEETVSTVQRWLTAAQQMPVPAAEARLATLLGDPDGPKYAREFIESVLRPADLKVAAHSLDRLSRTVPQSVKWHTDIGTQLAGGFAPLLSAPIVPAVRESFLKTVGGLFLRLGARDPDHQLAQLRGDGGVRPMLAPLGSPASGHREAHRQLADVSDLLSRDEVSAISIALPQLVGVSHLLDVDGDLEYALAQLDPLYALAAASPTTKFINLEVERLHELELTVRVFQALSERHPELTLGLSLPANLPESLATIERVTSWAMARTNDASSGPPIARTVIRLATGDHGDDEHAESSTRGWNSATFTDPIDTGAQLLRMLDAALTVERCAAVRIVVATHNLFDSAFAWRLARERGVEGSVEHEFLHGIDERQAHAVQRDVAGIQRYVPTLMHPMLALAVPYLMRRVDALANGEHHLAHVDDDSFARGKDLFLQALLRAMDSPPASLRQQSPDHATDTDFASVAHRDWAHATLLRARDSAAGEEMVERSQRASRDGIDGMVASALAAGASWGERRGATRAEVLQSVAETLAQWRGPLVEVAVSENRITLEEADHEVTVAVDAAQQAAVNAHSLDAMQGVRYVPPKLIVVIGSRSSPLANQAADTVAALAAGAAVIIKAARETERSSAVLIHCLLAAGVPEALLTLVCGEDVHAERLISHPDVDRVLVTGSRHTAKLVHSWNAETILQATICGRNSVIVTPSADLELAIPDLAASALDHAGQAATATNIAILVGSVGQSERFLGRLRDALSSIVAGSPFSPETQLASLARPAVDATLRALTELDSGETWLVRPRQVDVDGHVWTPGLRDGVAPGSTFHIAQNRAPVLGVMRVDSLAEAIELQNVLGFGLAAGIQSSDAAELTQWLGSVNAGMLFVNRPVVPGVRSSMPFGGWGRSTIGLGLASGGPNELIALGDWQPEFADPGTSVTLAGVGDEVTSLVEAAQPSMSFDEFGFVRAAVQNDEKEWQADFGIEHRLRDVPADTTVLRYRPLPVTIRLAEGAPIGQLVRVLAAAARAGASVSVSSAIPLPAALIARFGSRMAPVEVAEVLVENAVRWHARVQRGEIKTERIRLIGGDARVLARVLHGRPRTAVVSGQVTTNGRLELLTFLREQSVSADTRRTRRWLPFGGE